MGGVNFKICARGESSTPFKAQSHENSLDTVTVIAKTSNCNSRAKAIRKDTSECLGGTQIAHLFGHVPKIYQLKLTV